MGSVEDPDWKRDPLPLSRTNGLQLGLLWQIGTLWHLWQSPPGDLHTFQGSEARPCLAWGGAELLTN